ncbi:MAG: excisionase family DNA-binding protein [Gemmatimonadota bacterium]
MYGPEPSSERWVSVEEVASHLGVGKDSVYRWVESRGLPAHRVGRLFRFRLSEIDAWVSGQGGDRFAEARDQGADRVALRDLRAGHVAESLATYSAPTWPLEREEVEAAIDEMVRRIVEQFDPERIILFGSHARGDPGPDSDVDLLVVMEFEGLKREKQIEIRVALHDIRVPKDIVVATPDEIERYRDIIGTIIRPALREGRTLYERAA